jgi:predicted GTPase
LGDLVLKVYKFWNARVSTGMLNDWLQKVTQISTNDYENVLIQKVLLKIRYFIFQV